MSILLAASSALALDSEAEFLCGFLEGTYQVIGTKPDSRECYSGKIVLKCKGDHLQVVRTVNGKKIKGTGRIVRATADKIKVLRVEFTQGGRRYGATYLIGSDLDNYARLTGYLYLKKGKTAKPGLEALFIERWPLK